MNEMQLQIKLLNTIASVKRLLDNGNTQDAKSGVNLIESLVRQLLLNG